MQRRGVNLPPSGQPKSAPPLETCPGKVQPPIPILLTDELTEAQNVVALNAPRLSPPVRLPGYDASSGRVERWAFFSLGLVALTLIAMTTYQASQFALMGDGNSTANSNSEIAVAGNDTNAAAKKITTIPTKVHDESAGVAGASAPKS